MISPDSQVDEILFKMNALSSTSNLPTKEDFYYSEDSCTDSGSDLDFECLDPLSSSSERGLHNLRDPRLNRGDVVCRGRGGGGRGGDEEDAYESDFEDSKRLPRTHQYLQFDYDEDNSIRLVNIAH